MQKIVLAAVGCALATVAATLAAEDLAQAIAKCAIIKGDLERLVTMG